MLEKRFHVVMLILAVAVVLTGAPSADVRDRNLGPYVLDFTTPTPFRLTPDPFAENVPLQAGVVHPVAIAAVPMETDAVYNRFVNTTTGGLHFSLVLVEAQKGFPIRVEAVYNSMSANALPEELGPWTFDDLGKDWTMSYSDKIKDAGDTGPGGEHRVFLLDDRGRATVFLEASPGLYERETAAASPHRSLTRVSDTEFHESYRDGLLKKYAKLSPEDDQWVLVRIEDQLGRFIELTRTQGLITAIANSSGVAVTLVRPELQGGPPSQSSLKVHQANPPSGPSVSLTYSGATMFGVALGSGFSYNFVYSLGIGGGRILRIENEGNLVFRVLDYEDTGVKSVLTPSGLTNFTYAPATSKTFVTDPGGKQWIYEYDGLGRTIAMVDPESHTVSRTFDEDGNVASFTDGNGTTWNYQYDSSGRLTRETDPLGNASIFAYDGAGRLVTHTSPRGGITIFQYDTNGRLTRETDPAGVVWETTHTASGFPATVRNPDGPQLAFGYDAFHRRTSYTDASGRLTTVTRDDLGHPVVIQRANGSTYERVYNALGIQILTRDAEGHETSRAVDSRGRITSSTDEMGHTVTMTYDPSNRVTTVTDGVGRVTTYGYDACDRLTSVTDPNGGVTAFGYDGRGLLATVTDALGNATHYEYDANRSLTEKTFPNGRSITFAYDVLGRITSRTFPDGSQETYGYDANGNVLSMSGPGGALQVQYDLANRMTSITEVGHGLTTTYEYNAWGLRSRMVLPNQDEVTYQYDAAGRLATLLTPEGSYSVTYDPTTGELTQMVDPAGTRITLSYNTKGQVVMREERSANDELLSRDSYILDPRGRVIQETDADGNTTTYTYDGASQVASTTLPDGTTWTHTYDGRGNRIQSTAGINIITYQYNAINQITSINTPDGAFAYSYDAAGDDTTLMTITKTDPSGSTLIYKLDYMERAREMALGDDTHGYLYYPGEDQLMSSVAASWGNGFLATTGFLYNGTIPLAEFDASGELENAIYTTVGQPARVLLQGTPSRSSNSSELMFLLGRGSLFKGTDSVRTARLPWGYASNLSLLGSLRAELLDVERLATEYHFVNLLPRPTRELPRLQESLPFDGHAGRYLAPERVAGSAIAPETLNQNLPRFEQGSVTGGGPDSIGFALYLSWLWCQRDLINDLFSFESDETDCRIRGVNLWVIPGYGGGGEDCEPITQVTVSNVTACEGDTATFIASGVDGSSRNRTYRWYRSSGNNGIFIGAGALAVILDVELEDNGTRVWVEVENDCSIRRSNDATLTVVGCDYTPVEIRYKAVAEPPLMSTSWAPGVYDYFGGDGVPGSYTSPARSTQTMVVTVDPNVPDGVVSPQVPLMGITTAYNAACDTCSTTGGCYTPGCHDCSDNFRYAINQAPDCGPAVAQLGSDGNFLAMTTARVSSEEVRVDISGSVRLAEQCQPFTGVPYIDICVSVYIRQQLTQNGLGPVEYKITGAHDEFPWHSLYLNQQQVYEHDCCASSYGPFSLAGGCTGWPVPDSYQNWQLLGSGP